jgi:hypothetical protein
MTTRLFAVLLLTSLPGCATTGSPPRLAPGAPGYVAPSDRTLVAEVEPSFDSQGIYLQNNSSAVIVVTSVTITDCVNVTPCGLLPLQDRVEPGQRRKVASVRPVSGNEAYSYNYRWTWSVGPAR